MQIYLARDNQQAGPYTVDQLNQMLKNQQVLLTDLIWHTGMQEWKPVGDVTQGQLYYYPENTQPEQAASSNPFPSAQHLSSTASTNTQTELAPISKRAFAKFLDLCLWLPAFLFPQAFMNSEQHAAMIKLQSEVFTMAHQNNMEQAKQLSYQVFSLIPQSILIAMGVYLLLMLVGQAILLHKTGQSLGKKVLAIQIVDAQSKQQVGIGRSFFLRSFVFIIINQLFMPFTIFDWIFALGKKRQALHDYLAKTIVIEKK